MNPDVADAIAVLARDGVLAPAQASRLSRVARRELVSLHLELRLLAYAGVLLVTAGVGLLVQQNLQRIGPLTIAIALGLGALVCFAWVARHVPAFTWREMAAPHLALDYVLLLGALLAAACLGYVEAQFTPLGKDWAWHLLIVSAFYGLLAFRCDSRILFSLSLSTFAAWRGVSTGLAETTFFMSGDDAVRANAATCGLLFVAAGALLRRRGWKAHFEPTAVHLGWLFVLGAAVSALEERPVAFGLVLLLVAALLGGMAVRGRRFWLLAFAIVAAYVGVSALALQAIQGNLAQLLWFGVTPLAVVAALFVAHRFLREPA